MLVVVGPTGAGKSALALQLAEQAGAEIVSADSQQVYRGMDIGTGKADRRRAGRACPHHLLDVVAPTSEMTAARFVELADAAIAAVGGARPPRGGGGRHRAVRARPAATGCSRGRPADPALRAAARGRGGRSRRRAAGAVARGSREVDPEAAPRIDRRDDRRASCARSRCSR